jgi:hypothetical protein
VVIDGLEEHSLSIVSVKQTNISLLRMVTTCTYQSAWRNISEELDPKQHRSGTLNVAKCSLDVLVQQQAISIGNTVL